MSRSRHSASGQLPPLPTDRRELLKLLKALDNLSPEDDHAANPARREPGRLPARHRRMRLPVHPAERANPPADRRRRIGRTTARAGQGRVQARASLCRHGSATLPRPKKSLASPGANVLYTFAHMIPAPFIEKLTAILAWLAERLAEMRERNALRAQAALDQAALDQAEDDQAALDPTRAGALLAVCPRSPPGSAPSSTPESPQSPLPSRLDRDSFPPSPPALSPATPAPAAAAIVAPAAAAVPATHHRPHAEGSAAGSIAAPSCDGRPAGRRPPAVANPAPVWPDARGGSRTLRPASRSARQAADLLARAGRAEAVGWHANSAPSRAGLRMPILLRYRNK